MSAFEIAGNLLRRAAEHDTSKQYPEALQCYNDGISLLFNVLKGLVSKLNIIKFFYFLFFVSLNISIVNIHIYINLYD